MRLNKETFEVAAQIVFEYEGWGCEHVHDMFECYGVMGGDKPPCKTEDDLADACKLVQQFKHLGYDEAIEAAFKSQ